MTIIYAVCHKSQEYTWSHIAKTSLQCRMQGKKKIRAKSPHLFGCVTLWNGSRDGEIGDHRGEKGKERKKT